MSLFRGAPHDKEASQPYFDTYLQIVESRSEGNQVRQHVISTLGRFEDLQASGQLERLLRSG
jgi:hypothetical protein